MEASTRSFYWSRFGAAVAVVPLGVWTVNHLWRQLAALSSPAAWQRSVTEYPHPVAQGVALALVFAPLFIHTAWGVQRIFSARPNNVRYAGYGNLKYLLQRLSALGLLAFLGAHLWLAFIRPRFVEGIAEPFADIAGAMRHHAPTLVVYLLGTLAVAFHLANGFASALWTWGARPRRGVAEVTFAILLALGWGAVYALWRAG
jgi:succinate dehydrogenase / fumarate reductase cytochrome b subunit